MQQPPPLSFARSVYRDGLLPMAFRVISVRCGIWSLSEHSGLWQAIRPADLWVHGLIT